MTREPRPQPDQSELVEPEAPLEEYGRIGYGRYARYTPYGLAAVIVAVVVVIAFFQHGSGDAGNGIGQLIGKQAPDFNLTTFDGSSIQLTGERGSVVVLNFWAEWCEPCKQEMPAFQTVWTASAASGAKLKIIGVNIKNDNLANAQAFAKTLGVTYPLGHDVSPGATIRGLIESSYGMGGQYPATVFIRPDGVIDSVNFGPMTADVMRQRIAAATGQ